MEPAALRTVISEQVFIDECNRRLRRERAPCSAKFWLTGSEGQERGYEFSGWDRGRMAQIAHEVRAQFGVHS